MESNQKKDKKEKHMLEEFKLRVSPVEDFSKEIKFYRERIKAIEL